MSYLLNDKQCIRPTTGSGLGRKRKAGVQHFERSTRLGIQHEHDTDRMNHQTFFKTLTGSKKIL